MQADFGEAGDPIESPTKRLFDACSRAEEGRRLGAPHPFEHEIATSTYQI